MIKWGWKRPPPRASEGGDEPSQHLVVGAVTLLSLELTRIKMRVDDAQAGAAQLEIRKGWEGSRVWKEGESMERGKEWLGGEIVEGGACRETRRWKEEREKRGEGKEIERRQDWGKASL